MRLSLIAIVAIAATVIATAADSPDPIAFAALVVLAGCAIQAMLAIANIGLYFTDYVKWINSDA